MEASAHPVPEWAAPGNGPVRVGVRRWKVRVMQVVAALMLAFGGLALAFDPSAGAGFATLFGLVGNIACMQALRDDLPALLLDESGFQLIGLGEPRNYGPGAGELVRWGEVAEFVLDSNVDRQNTTKLAMARFKVARPALPTALEQLLPGEGPQGHYFPTMLRLGPKPILAVLEAWHARYAHER